MKKERLINCDILRILALIFVISVHSLSYIGFYSTITEGPTMLFSNMLRCLFMSCVPIFIILSGYLMSKRELNKKYLFKIVRILITYLICSILCFILINIIEGNTKLSVINFISGILSYSAAPYAWYVNMYLGLFLIIPFLNILWNNLKDKRQKQYLLLILFIIGILPNAINIFNLEDPSWWLNPASSREYHQLVPNFWMETTYVILYYFIGCYLKDYKLKLSRKNNIILLILSIILFGLFNYYRNYNALFGWETYVGYASLEVLIVTILVVNLILNLKINIKSTKVTKIISKVSYLTFGAYLVSAIFDKWLYPILNEHTNTLLERLPYLLLIIPIITILSLVLSYFVELLSKLLNKIGCLIINKGRLKKKKNKTN